MIWDVITMFSICSAAKECPLVHRVSVHQIFINYRTVHIIASYYSGRFWFDKMVWRSIFRHSRSFLVASCPVNILGPGDTFLAALPQVLMFEGQMKAECFVLDTRRPSGADCPPWSRSSLWASNPASPRTVSSAGSSGSCPPRGRSSSLEQVVFLSLPLKLIIILKTSFSVGFNRPVGKRVKWALPLQNAQSRFLVVAVLDEETRLLKSLWCWQHSRTNTITEDDCRQQLILDDCSLQ